MSHVLAGVAGVLLIAVVLRDAFEAVILPQTANRSVRLARLFYIATWGPWIALGTVVNRSKRREAFLAVYGPLSILLLFVFWALCLILGFALLQWSFGSHLELLHGEKTNFLLDLYMSGTNFFTLGLGDVTPQSTVSRLLTVIEAGMGFGFLAAIISYLPVLYQAFSRRELSISLLDARAGSPPTAEMLFRRHGDDSPAFERQLAEWERWAAELMESHLSYPTLAYYRSQHQNQSWLAALTTILDTSAFTMATFDGSVARQARLTFAMARHAVVDLSQIFHAKPDGGARDRLPDGALARMCEHARRLGLEMRETTEAKTRLAELRRFYEPYVLALGRRFHLVVPDWSPEQEHLDNWKTSAWQRTLAGQSVSDLHGDGDG
ncbi:MAG TPA: potassium channel family protein [Candidatus Eisenbacteria bacterium]|nr:potassium channel family protein [Candidatus Eisenbacteria bacterium]